MVSKKNTTSTRKPKTKNKKNIENSSLQEHAANKEVIDSKMQESDNAHIITGENDVNNAESSAGNLKDGNEDYEKNVINDDNENIMLHNDEESEQKKGESDYNEEEGESEREEEIEIELQPENKEKFQFGTETAKLLRLVIHSIYTNKNIFLRELVSNAVDAINKRKYESLKQPDFSLHNSDYQVNVKISEKNKYILVRDNGIGMNKDELINNLGIIARSGTEQFVKQLAENSNNDLIGQFGLGFYSGFMVGDRIQVKTKKIGEKSAWLWESLGQGDYEIAELDPVIAENMSYGTDIKIYLSEENQETYLDIYQVENIIKTYSSHTGIKITIDNGIGKTIEISAGTALWHRDKKDIEPEEYKELYRSLSHLPDSPLFTINYKGEGLVNFKTILFVPSMKPFNLFSPERLTHVKLYVRKVFINEEKIDIFPKYLRFAQGIIESDELQLNISRETFQNNSHVKMIKDAVTKKFLSELKSLAKNEPENYLKFWQHFGQVFKEGLCEQDTDREALLELTRFYSSKSPNKFISLEEYIAGKSEKQKQIFFSIGTSSDEINNNPQMEIFLKNNIEVLFLNEVVDGFWTTVAHNYKGVDFVSISRSDINLEDLVSSSDQIKRKDDDEDNAAQLKMTKAFEKSLEGKISSVAISNKLTDSPACLSIKNGAMDIAMEKFLIEQNQLKSPTLKMLEINPDHKLVKQAYESLISDDADKQNKGNKMSAAIFELACLSQGENLNNPSSFAKRIINLLNDNL